MRRGGGSSACTTIAMSVITTTQSRRHLGIGRRARPGVAETSYTSCLLFVLVLLLLPVWTAGGSNGVVITRAMSAASHHQNPDAKGMRDLIVTRDNLAVTNSENQFYFWYEELEEGDVAAVAEAQKNNAIRRWFVCKYDNTREQFCGSPPEESDVNNPNGQQGGMKR